MNWEEVLKTELTAADGSFLLTLRSEYRWDRARFSVLARALWACCRATCDEDQLPRWLAGGVWELCSGAPGIISHPDFHREHPEEYFERARELLMALGTEFFSGEPMWEGEPEWVD
jgi:hypothetical protein